MVTAKSDLVQAAHCAVIEAAFAEENRSTGKTICAAAILLQQNGVNIFDDVFTCALEIRNQCWHKAKNAAQRVGEALKRNASAIESAAELGKASETLSKLPQIVKQKTPGVLAGLRPKDDAPPYL